MRAAKTKTEIRQEQIAAAALELMARLGPKALNLARLAREVGVVPSATLQPDAAAEVIERPEHVLIPGLVNAHTHAAMSLLRNAGGGLALDAWLRQRMWPLEARLVDEQFVADGTELAIAEMLLGGMTCFADMYYYRDAAARVAAQAGMRAAIGMPVLEQPQG